MRNVDVRPVSARTRRVCAFHFAVAAAADLAVGLALIRFAASEGAERSIGRYVARFLGSGTALDWGPGAFSLIAVSLGALGVAFLGVGAAQSVAALYSLRGRRRRVCLFAGGIGVLTVVSLPWSAVGSFLVGLAGEQFDRRTPPSERSGGGISDKIP